MAKLFSKRKRTASSSSAVAVQTGNAVNPFGALAAYSPTSAPNMELYSGLREAVPIIDAAIYKLLRLVGTFTVTAGEKAAQRELDRFLQTALVDGERRGIDAFISSFFEQLLTYGTAVGEMVLAGGEIVQLHNASLKAVALSRDESTLKLTVSSKKVVGPAEPVKYPELVLVSVHNPEPESVYGTSILKGLPFVSNVLLKIFNTIGTNWERLGNVRYAVTYKPGADEIDRAYAGDRAMEMAREWSKTMSDTGTVKDFITVGDVEIKAIGADNQILNSEIPVRQMLEQIVAKMGIPPFLLGLSWSSTERMSSQQADVLTSEIDAYRRELTPVIEQIAGMWLRLHGYDAGCQVVWDNVTLQDITEIAKSELYQAQRDKILAELMSAGD